MQSDSCLHLLDYMTSEDSNLPSYNLVRHCRSCLGINGGHFEHLQ
jgi:hypothetical protein